MKKQTILVSKDINYDMDKRFLAGGGVLLIVGLFLTLAFWPIFGVSGSELAEDRDGLQYESYDEGDEVLVYGVITSIGEPPDWLDEELGVFVQIDDEINLILTDVDSTDFEEGDEVYGRLRLNTILTYEYWELDDELNSKRTVDYLFYGITGAGLVIAIVGAVKD